MRNSHTLAASRRAPSLAHSSNHFITKDVSNGSPHATHQLVPTVSLGVPPVSSHLEACKQLSVVILNTYDGLIICRLRLFVSFFSISAGAVGSDSATGAPSREHQEKIGHSKKKVPQKRKRKVLLEEED
ncbi:hypothetical protein HPB48_003413 [Haemaphysalis longicornis]|uniref:Uncharacterized protein n=1 Tax=Haemaphysalis longicornis TaxID=44386 RepID=A0A9J6FMZ4_HAELO|nr:hypothetical protein HPB48_003413 [Haemaphysalis longicornis]